MGANLMLGSLLTTVNSNIKLPFFVYFIDVDFTIPWRFLVQDGAYLSQKDNAVPRPCLYSSELAMALAE
jgi:hypothetical protein